MAAERQGACQHLRITVFSSSLQAGYPLRVWQPRQLSDEAGGKKLPLLLCGTTWIIPCLSCSLDPLRLWQPRSDEVGAEELAPWAEEAALPHGGAGPLSDNAGDLCIICLDS